jgi:aspartate aminotransferase
MLATRLDSIQLSPTFRVNALARSLREKGVDVVDLSVGEPDFPTPAPVKEAGKGAIDRDLTRYTANEGTLALRQAIAAKLLRDNALAYEPTEIVVSPGAKASLFCAAMALFDPGDEVLIPSPYWVSHPEMVRLAGATPVFVPAREDEGFRVDPDALVAAITGRTRGLILNYPSNPTGATYTPAQLRAIGDLCVRRDLVILADEIYEKLVYDGRAFTGIASLDPAFRARTVVVNGMSKAYAMTGWRVGFAAAPREIAEAIARVQSHSTGHPASMSQEASVAALLGGEESIAAMRVEFERRRDEVVRSLAAIPGVTCVPPEGAFYAFPNLSGLFGRSLRDGAVVRSGQDVAVRLLEKAHVAVVPGEAFGSLRHVRLSFACSMERLREGLARIVEALS